MEVRGQKSEIRSQKLQNTASCLRRRAPTFFFALLFFSSVLLSTSSARAEGLCYSQKQFEADRGLRLHADLEVILLTCRYASNGEPLQKGYAAFLKRRGGQIHRWENVIARAYAGGGVGRNAAIDNFRTWLANQKGNESAAMGPKAFCKQWSDFIHYANGLNDAQFMAYIRENDPKRPPKRPLCDGVPVASADGVR